MILQSLNQYYERLATKNEVPIYGMSNQGIHYAIVINTQGEPVSPYINDLYHMERNRVVPRYVNIPKIGGKRTSGIKPYFLWDKSDYILGFTVDENGEFVECKKHFEKSKCFHREILKNISHPKAQAIVQFFQKWNPEKGKQISNWREFAGRFFVFQLEGERSFVHQEPTIIDKWSEYVLSLSKNQKHKAQCLITGEIGDIPALHPSIVGVFNAHTAGAGIVAINKDKTAFCSYNKTQGYNSPISELAAFKYTTTLNRLLQNNSMQKIQIGDATTVFWTERESPIEGMFGMMLDPKDLDTPDKAELLHVLEAIKEGKKPQEIDPNVKFYILGLSPNGPRLSIRFWHVCEVGQVEENIGKHFKDLNIQRSYESDPQYPGVRKLLYETINKKSRDKEPSPLLAGAMMRSILEGAKYPESLLSSILNRIRADRNINYMRAAMLKAILSRKYRKQEMEVSVMLNKENKNCAYLLGRLFAVLERVQKEAIPGANTTIKDRFYGSASATPRVVFPQLLRLTQHHIQKAKYGHLRDKEIEEIIRDIQEFPSHLKLDEQGVFAIGYYHQRNNKEN